MKDTYFEGLMRSLTEEQLKEIGKHFTDCDADYVTFLVSVFNTGTAVRLEFTNTPTEFDPESWNGYDVCLPIDDVALAIMKYNL